MLWSGRSMEAALSGPRSRCLVQPAEPQSFRSGFACFVGRPNAGKSTLTNALVGEKIAITSSRPQTTRHAIRGILHRPDAQLVVVDTPGRSEERRVGKECRSRWSPYH